MPREFKLSSPLNMPVELRRSRQEIVRAYQLVELAHVRLANVYQVIKFTDGLEVTPEGREALGKLDRALDALADTRQKLGDSAYQVEQVLKLGGREP